MDEVIQESKPEAIHKTTLGEWGPQLPIGVLDPAGQVGRSLEVRKWRMKEEKEIGALRAEHRNKNVGKYVSALLARMCTKLGPHTFDDSMRVEDRLLIINQMYMADVLYAYVWLRFKSLGKDLPFAPRCPYCRNEFSFKANLNSLDVVAVFDHEKMPWEYELSEPISVRGKEVTKLVIGSPRWAMLESADNSAISELNTGGIKSALIYASVQSLGDEQDVALAPGELDDLVKYDIEELTRLMDERTMGPIMALEGACPRPACGRTFQLPVNWTSEDFFSTSSQ